MDNNRRYRDDDDSRNLEENQRIGRDKARARGDQNWNEQYRSGQSYHNRGEGYSPEQTHYGSRPDSAYRDQNRINYGDNRDRSNNQYSGQNQNWRQDQHNQYNQDRNQSRGQKQKELPDLNPNTQHNYRQGFRGGNNDQDFDRPPQGDHAGTRFWGEREQYKQEDYRYSSGNRGNWETPGVGRNDDDDNDRNRYRYDRNDRNDYRRHDQDRGFFERAGDSINNAWNSLTGNDDNDNDNYRRNQHPQNRNFNRGYESGPRWADENDNNDRNRNQNRYNRRDRDDY